MTGAEKKDGKLDVNWELRAVGVVGNKHDKLVEHLRVNTKLATKPSRAVFPPVIQEVQLR